MDQLASIDGQWSLLPPSSSPKPNFYIPPEFSNKVTLHILKNNIKSINPPLILAIQGNKGEGKSSQTRELCSQLGIYVVSLSGSTISGSHEKEPVLILQQAYLYASAIRSSREKLVVLLIDDLDTSVASVQQDRRYTVNSQLVSGFLMNLADDPYHIGERKTHRVPIIVTGNDFTNLYEPLTRHGRTSFFDWNPGIDTKVKIIKHIFKDHVNASDYSKFIDLVDQFSKESIAFFQEIRNDLYDPIILQAIQEGIINISSIEQSMQASRAELDIEELFKLCEIKKDSKARNYNS